MPTIISPDLLLSSEVPEEIRVARETCSECSLNAVCNPKKPRRASISVIYADKNTDYAGEAVIVVGERAGDKGCRLVCERRYKPHVGQI